jgi:hypothetical protein
LKEQIALAKKTHDYDLSMGYGAVYLPYTLTRKYKNSASEFRWQYIFPSSKISKDPKGEELRRHHIHEGWIQKVVRKGVRDSGILIGTVLRHDFWKVAMIYARFRNYWVIQI